MTIQECYTALGGNYEEVLGRLYSEALVKKFVVKFLADQSYQLLESSLKGVTQNLGFIRLYESSHEITEALRTKDYDLAAQLFPRVEADYLQTAAAIQAFQATQ